MKLTLLVAAAATVAAVAVAQAQTMASPPANPASSRMSPTTAAHSGTPKAVPRGDRTFADKAAQAGLGEVAEAQVAAQKSDRQDVKDFAQRMITDHTKANDKLKQVASDEGFTIPSAPSAADQREVDKLQSESGAKLDRDYVMAQRSAHKEAVKLFTKESEKGKDPGLKNFAAETLPTLQDHLKMISSMSPTKPGSSSM